MGKFNYRPKSSKLSSTLIKDCTSSKISVGIFICPKSNLNFILIKDRTSSKIVCKYISWELGTFIIFGQTQFHPYLTAVLHPNLMCTRRCKGCTSSRISVYGLLHFSAHCKIFLLASEKDNLIIKFSNIHFFVF